MSPTPRGRALTLVALLASCACAGLPAAGQGPAPPSVLLVTAHPDDETMFAGSVYKLTHALGARVDLAVVTSGEGGYRYASLAEPIYGLRLTDEATARAHLPRIRKRELLAGGELLGLRGVFFLDQPDRGYTQDARDVLDRQWDAAAVRQRLREILARGRYEFVFVPLPTASTHGAHQAAAILALEAVASLPAGERPAVLGGTDFKRGDPQPAFDGHSGEYPAIAVRSDRPALQFDRRQTLGYGARLDYRIVVDWVIAEHKSQGLLQTEMGAADGERFLVFALDDDRAAAAAEVLFRRLAGFRADAGASPIDPQAGRHCRTCPVEP